MPLAYTAAAVKVGDAVFLFSFCTLRDQSLVCPAAHADAAKTSTRRFQRERDRETENNQHSHR